jgi:hypothetical protein
VKTNRSRTAAAARIVRVREDLLGRLRPCFVRTQTWQQADRYVSALVSDLPKRNGWTIAQQIGDRTPDRVRRFAADGLDAVARRGRRRGMVVGALDETGQQKRGGSTCGVKRQYVGCAGRVENGINIVHLAYIRE